MTESEFTTYQRYNALDCAMTLAVFAAIQPHLDNLQASTYSLSKQLVGPATEMMLRGLRLDQGLLNAKSTEIAGKKATLLSHLRTLASAAGEENFNPNSPAQIVRLLHDRLPVQPILKRNKNNEYRPSTAREDLEKLMESEGGAVSILLRILLEYRDYKKALESLSMRQSPDHRWRCTTKISGTTTGRWSTAEDSFGNGGNLQNLHESVKPIVIADPGYTFISGDLSQADSWNVGISVWEATGDDVFLSAVQSGDIHTFTAKLAWPELPWTGDLSRDREIAEQLFYRHHSYRFMCKKINHGTAYGMRYRTLARNVRIPERIALEVFERYQRAFPSLFDWQNLVWMELKSNGYLVTLLNRKRYFLGRLNDPKTFREAIAFLGQSPTADIINTALVRLHAHPRIQLLMQEHDSILMQVRDNEVEELAPFIHSAFRVPLETRQGRTFYTPVDLKSGRNWGAFDAQKNPLGLKKLTPMGAQSGVLNR